jgi:cyanophycinase
MNGLIALVGSGEYLPVMEGVDRHLLASLNLNGRKPRVVCLPTAAGKEGDGSINRWSKMGIEHFQLLGAEVNALRIIDRASADDLQWASYLESADLIYFSGGDPAYLYRTMKDSRAWSAMQKAWHRGAVYAGCSAGAMILAKRMPSFRLRGVQEGFGIVPATFIIPHYDAIPGIWKPFVYALKSQMKKGETMLGVDENTALVGSLEGEWKVMGIGKVHIISRKEEKTYYDGESLTL